MKGPPDSRAPRTVAAGEARDIELNTPTVARGEALSKAVSPLVTVMRDRFVQGWPGHDDGERVYTMRLDSALTREWTTDVHLVQYVSPNGRRLRVGALEHVEVALTTIVFDCDCPDVHGTGEPAPESWRASFRRKVEALAERHIAPFMYETRGGARIVYAQQTPTVLRSPEDAREWRQHYTIAVAYLERCFGIVADPACADWTRLFRAPFVVRDGSNERRATHGDPQCIGALSIDATDADVQRAKEIAPKAFGEYIARDLTPSVADGYGLLYYALRARGDLGREHGQSAFVIRCPRENEHTSGRTGDGSTLLYLPAAGEEIGAIHCLHAHCCGLTLRDWLREFSSYELEAARQAAGITRAA